MKVDPNKNDAEREDEGIGDDDEESMMMVRRSGSVVGEENEGMAGMIKDANWVRSESRDGRATDVKRPDGVRGVDLSWNEMLFEPRGQRSAQNMLNREGLGFATYSDSERYYRLFP